MSGQPLFEKIGTIAFCLCSMSACYVSALMETIQAGLKVALRLNTHYCNAAHFMVSRVAGLIAYTFSWIEPM